MQDLAVLAGYRHQFFGGFRGPLRVISRGSRDSVVFRDRNDGDVRAMAWDSGLSGLSGFLNNKLFIINEILSPPTFRSTGMTLD